MTSESKNKKLARRFLEEVVNTGAVELGVVRWAGDLVATGASAQPGVAPNVDPATLLTNTGATAGPASVS